MAGESSPSVTELTRAHFAGQACCTTVPTIKNSDLPPSTPSISQEAQVKKRLLENWHTPNTIFLLLLVMSSIAGPVTMCSFPLLWASVSLFEI